MAAHPWCSGPVAVYIAPGGSGPLYVGTGENAPKWHVRPAYGNVMNDLGGSMLPFDVQYEGHEGFVTVRFTRWNYANMQLIEAFGSTAGAGIDKFGSMGTLVDTEGSGFMQVYLVYSYGSKAAMAGMPGGVHFPVATVEDYAVQPGTGQNSIDVTWHCRRTYKGGDFIVFDHEVGGLPPTE